MVLATIITVMIESIVAVFFAARDVLWDRLLSSIGWLPGSEDATERLKRSLNRLQTVVSRAGKTSKGSEYLELWGLEIRDLVYGVEDIFDEISYESVKNKVEGEAATGIKRKLLEIIGFFDPDFIGKHFNSRQRIARMSERAVSLDKWADRVLSYISTECTGGENDFRNLVPASSRLSGEMILGRDEDKDELIEFLFSDTSSRSPSVMAVVGMAGIGKTALAQLIFNDSRVTDHFESKTWIYVSQNFDILRLTKSLIESIMGQTCNLVELDTLQHRLQEVVWSRRVLLVLDDVWNESLHLWEVFASPLRTSVIKIIVTTQNESVAAVMQTIPPLKLKMLPEDECVQMLKIHAFSGRRGILEIQSDNDIGKKYGKRKGIPVIQSNKDIVKKLPLVGLENDYPEFLKAASLTIKKCQGLPLAVKELGCRLRNVTHYETQDRTWLDILRADFNPTIEFTTGMFSSLKFSYDVLPANLKRCIAYCSLFPTDYVFMKDHLARLWVAQGFVQFESKANLGDVTRVTREDVCRGYFDELVRRSFFLPVDSTSDLGGFKIHILIHSLCKYVSTNEVFSFEKSELLQKCPQLHGEIRHLYVSSDKPVVVPYHIPIRTYIYNDIQFNGELEESISKDMFLNLKYVRSLAVNCSTVRILPDSFGNLKYLKYLRLSCPRIDELPESISNLYNLQMLDLCGCNKLAVLPPSIGNLIELWFLGLPLVKLREGVVSLRRGCRIPPEIGRLTSLRTLSGIVFISRYIHVLNRLVNLQGDLYLDGLEFSTNPDDAIEADIKGKKFLEILRLQWREPSNSSLMPSHGEVHLLKNLEPHTNLRELVIIGYGGRNFPSWLSDSSFSNLTNMTLLGCKLNKCRDLPALGQLPFLKSLYIGWMPAVWRVGIKFLGLTQAHLKAFPCLVELSFEEMYAWEYWQDVGHEDFPVLRELTIKNCQHLIELPDFRLLTELTIIGCDRLEAILLKSTQYSHIIRLEKTEVDELVELPPTICGRDDDTNRIIEFLLSNKSGEHNVAFMCVVAPSGVGKTTIIHHVYINDTVSEAFDTRIWLSIPGVFNEKTLMKEIIETITHLACVRGDLSLLHEIVQEELSGKKFLLILDGAQNENKSFWSSVRRVLNVGVRGSRVVVATKSQVVADAVGSEYCHYLDYVSNDNCWSIFGGLNPKLSSYLIERCRYLVEKCECIPLCVKMIAGCFHNAKTEEIIMALLESKSWETDKWGGRVLPALRVCHEFLPFELRKLFAYCALFPKDHVFVKDHIVRLWMSQGFIYCIGGENVEDIGIRYFDELVARSFLHISPIHDVKDGKFFMHELVHDLAECIAWEEYFRSEDCLLEGVPGNIAHLSLAPREIKSKFNNVEFRNELENVELNRMANGIRNLQTFLVVNRFTPQLYNIGSPIVNLLGLNEVFKNCRHIKTLDLSDSDIKELPESIGLLKSLRFLGINNTRINSIPRQICILPKLETLEAQNCFYLVELPTNLKALTNLRHLDTRKESGFVAIPSGIGCLTNLRTLPAFNVGNDEFHSSIGELKNLRHLKGELQITGIDNIKNINEAQEAELERKDSLEILVLQWCGTKRGDETGKFSEGVLGFLQPPSNIQEMVIRNYIGTQFPSWMEDQLFPKLVLVTLDNCFNCNKFPHLGNVPFLKYFCAQKMHLVQTLSVLDSRSANNHPKFRYLEVLKLSEMHGLEDLFQVEDGDFPCLRSLSINRCPLLRKIPGFACLVELSLSCCPELPDIFDLSSVEFLKIDRVENLEFLDLRNKLPMLKKLEINNCKELSSVILSDGASTVKTKFIRCPKLDPSNVWGTVSIQGEFAPVTDASEDSERGFGQQSEEIDDDYLLDDY